MRVNGSALRAIRTDRKVTLRSLAATAGVSASYLSLIERDLRGTSHVDKGVIAALATALDVPLAAVALKGRAS